jgi:hypothetical protein
MRKSDVAYIVNRYPLVDRRLSRSDCILWLRQHGYPIPAKSACLGCPYHSNDTWREMKRSRPGEWQETVAFDKAVRRGLPGVKGEAFLHRSLLPLDLVDLRSAAERGQLQMPGFSDECSGYVLQHITRVLWSNGLCGSALLRPGKSERIAVLQTT